MRLSPNLASQAPNVKITTLITGKLEFINSIDNDENITILKVILSKERSTIKK